MNEPKMITNPTDLAFAGQMITRHGNEVSYGNGLTKREWFAGIILSGMLAKPIDQLSNYNTIAQSSVEFADQLLEELNK